MNHLLGRLLLILIIANLALCIEDVCTPYYPRMFWNPEAAEILTNKIDHIFMWNTNYSCPYSFVKVSTSNGAFKFRCKEKRIETFNDDGSL